MVFSKSSTLLLLAASATAQFIPPPTDLIKKRGYAGIDVRYKEVPAGICELDPNVKSYSGYADVEKDQHIFWWFFEARNQDPKDAPLTVWINGGPGSSSLIGLFQELGPCGIGPDLKPFNNPYSWTNASNMLFIDQPTTTGFSYTIPIPGYTDADGNIIELLNSTCPAAALEAGTCGTYSKPDGTLTANNTAGAAPNMWKTLQGFMGAFPQYSRNDFNFATESYGGHYAPIFNGEYNCMPFSHRRLTLNSVHSRSKHKERLWNAQDQSPERLDRKRLVRSTRPVSVVLQLHRQPGQLLRLWSIQWHGKGRVVSEPVRRG